MSVPPCRRSCLVVLALLVCAPGAAAERQPDLDTATREVIKRSNAFRRAQGLPPTTPDAALMAAASEFAAYMARTDRYSHAADGRQPAQRAQQGGYAYSFYLHMVAENIAHQYHGAGFATGELALRLVQGWIDSPGHRHNLLAAEAVDTGVAIARSPRTRRYYAVQMFGRPAARRLRFEITNQSPKVVEYELGGAAYTLPPRLTRFHEQCLAQPLAVALPGQPVPTRLQPADGARYRVESDGRTFRVAATMHQ